jgi:hypothetical protein
LIRLPSFLFAILRDGGTVVVPSRQRAHAAALAFAAARLDGGARVWATPDVLTLDAWLIREVEQLACGQRVPRLLSPAEDWLLWRQCTAAATQDLELLNRGSLAESLRYASGLAAEFGIDIENLPALAGAEAELLSRTQRAVSERCRELGAVNIQSLADSARLSGGVTCAGFLQHARLRNIGAVQQQPCPDPARPTVVIAADETDELERIAEWCQRQIESKADTRLLVVLPGSPGARERLAALIRQAVDPYGALLREGSDAQSDDLVVIEGGTPLADVPVVAHALSTLRWLAGSTGDFEAASEWLRAPY